MFSFGVPAWLHNLLLSLHVCWPGRSRKIVTSPPTHLMAVSSWFELSFSFTLMRSWDTSATMKLFNMVTSWGTQGLGKSHLYLILNSSIPMSILVVVMFWSFVRKHFKTIINGGGNIRDDIEFIEDKSVSCVSNLYHFKDVFSIVYSI